MLHEILEACPICKSITSQTYLTVKDYSISKEVFTIVKCTRCNFLFTNPRPDTNSLSNYYESENYISHANKSNNPVNLIYKLARSFTLRWKYKLIKEYKPTTLLDYGCGTGHFLSYCKNKNLKVEGYEPNDEARLIANQQLNNCVYDTPNLLSDSYEAITLWHVLEHIPDVNEVMIWLKEHLTTNGHLIIALPNPESYDAILFKKYWAAYDVPRHLYHFTKETFTQLANKHGFCIQSILPMKLDAYYVSLLSNSYKYGWSRPIKSFINGFISNTYARKSKNYSSLIYVLTHEND